MCFGLGAQPFGLLFFAAGAGGAADDGVLSVTRGQRGEVQAPPAATGFVQPVGRLADDLVQPFVGIPGRLS